jgi:hypothetical protein
MISGRASTVASVFASAKVFARAFPPFAAFFYLHAVSIEIVAVAD